MKKKIALFSLMFALASMPVVSSADMLISRSDNSEVEYTLETDIDLADFRKLAFYSAEATSELGKHYIAEYAIDGSMNTAWQEAAKGYGIGEGLTLSFKKEQEVAMLALHLGYKPYYETNGRPREIEFTFSDGSSCVVEFKDKNTDQYVVFDRPVWTDTIELRIVSIYDGTQYEDTCITEITAYRNK